MFEGVHAHAIERAVAGDRQIASRAAVLFAGGVIRARGLARKSRRILRAGCSLPPNRGRRRQCARASFRSSMNTRWMRQILCETTRRVGRIDAFCFGNIPTFWHAHDVWINNIGSQPSPSFLHATSFGQTFEQWQATQLWASHRKKLRHHVAEDGKDRPGRNSPGGRFTGESTSDVSSLSAPQRRALHCVQYLLQVTFGSFFFSSGASAFHSARHFFSRASTAALSSLAGCA